MPTIPQIGEPQVAPGIPPLVKPYAKGPLELGAGLGAGLSDAGVSIQREQAREKAKADAAAIDNALLALETQGTNALIDFDKKEGNDAGVAAQPTVAAYEKARADILSRLTPEQQQEFSRISGHHANSFRQHVLSRGADEQSRYYKATLDNGQQGSVSRVLDAVQRDGLAALEPPQGPRQEGDTSPQTEQEVAYDQLERYAAAHDGELGMPKEEWLRQHKQEYDSAYTVAVVEALMQRGDDEGAEAYFQANQSKIVDPKARLSLGDATASRGKDARVESAATAILADAERPGKDGVEPTEGEKLARVRAAIEALPAGDRKAVRSRVDQIQTDDAENLRIAQSANFDKLHLALQDGTPLKDIEATPMFLLDDEGGINPDQRDALRVYSQRLREGDFTSTDRETWKRINGLLETNPSALLKINTNELTAGGKLSSDDAKQVEAWKASIAKAASGKGDDAMKLSMTRHDIRKLWAEKIELDPDAYTDFDLSLLEQERRAQKAKGAELTDEEYDTLVRRAVVKMTVERPWYQGGDFDVHVGGLTDKGYAYLEAHPESVDFEDIPPADVERFRSDLVAAGRPADDDAVRLEWVKYLVRLRARGE